MKLQTVALVLCLVTLAGCSASAVRTSETSTSQASYHLDCSGTFLSIQSCVDKANNVCPQGYDVIDKSIQQVAERKSQSRQHGAVVGKELKEMDIHCH